MQCPNCLKEFKNKNSYRVHRWRFHNLTSTYRLKTPALPETDFNAADDLSGSSLALPMVAATVGLASTKGDWKKWLVLLLILLALGIVVWYLSSKKSEEERPLGS
jgi:hypothetical protein